MSSPLLRWLLIHLGLAEEDEEPLPPVEEPPGAPALAVLAPPLLVVIVLGIASAFQRLLELRVG